MLLYFKNEERAIKRAIILYYENLENNKICFYKGDK